MSERSERERRIDPFGLTALVASGTLVAHQAGYLTDADARAAHTYLAVVGPLVLLVAFAAAWTAALRILRHDPGRAPTLGALIAAQSALYLAMETAERAVDGGYGSLGSSPVVVGLLAQPLVAWAALRLLGVGGRALRAFAVARRVPTGVRVRRRPTPLALVVSLLPRSEVRLRGPPVG